MKTEFSVGRILKPRGLRGELKFEAYSGCSERFANIKTVKLDGVAYSVEKISPEGAFGYVKFVGVDTLELAEKLRNLEISVSRDELPPLPEGRHYIADMLGIEVFTGGSRLGVLQDVLQYGSADVYVIKLENGTVSVPAIKELVKSVDIENGVMVLDERTFVRTAVYN